MINAQRTAHNARWDGRKQSLARSFITFGYALCAMRFALCVAYAQPVSSSELINNAKQHDGETVVYSGEIIGDCMARGDYAWVNLNDGESAIGVWMSRVLADEVEYTGSYKSQGDWFEVKGIFNRACKQHGGDLDIHATAVRKLRSGRRIPGAMDMHKWNLVLSLTGALVLAWILIRLKAR